mmetsp:Transcript_837/g.1588  ORF Transcript_837/g.1588 Transcript_837/m.1588 type:complete len:120 (+) Transcript_837:480-839(+)|eukprot:scaffold260568_cov32-Tisochrysis_lutea.AAC.2
MSEFKPLPGSVAVRCGVQPRQSATVVLLLHRTISVPISVPVPLTARPEEHKNRSSPCGRVQRLGEPSVLSPKIRIGAHTSSNDYLIRLLLQALRLLGRQRSVVGHIHNGYTSKMYSAFV